MCICINGTVSQWNHKISFMISIESEHEKYTTIVIFGGKNASENKITMLSLL